jgi:hypothetical protein
MPWSCEYPITSKLWAVVTPSVKHLDEFSDIGLSAEEVFLTTEEDGLLPMAWKGVM